MTKTHESVEARGDTVTQWLDSDGTMHETCKIMFIVDNAVVSEGTLDTGNPTTGYRRGGVAYICRECGEAWAHALVIDSHGNQMPFDLVPVACEKHSDQWEIPGSLLSGLHNAGYLNVLSPMALRREFIIHHNHIRTKSGLRPTP